MAPDNRLHILLGQYGECLAYIRHLDSLIWQIPTIAMAINAFLVSQYFNQKHDLTQIGILFFSGFFTFVELIALIKHRFSQESKVEDFKWIQNEIMQEVKNMEIREIKVITREIYCDTKQYCKLERNWFRRRSAYYWLMSFMCVSLIFIIFSLVIKLLLYFKFIY